MDDSTIQLGAVKVRAKDSSAVEGEKRASDEDEEEYVPPTKRLIHPGDVLDLTTDLDRTEVVYVGTSGEKITVLDGLEALSKLRLVSFRSNFIRAPTGLSHLATTLTSLELYENRLKTLKGVEELVNLRVLDVSYNRLKTIELEFVGKLTRLEKLYVAENRLKEMVDLPKCIGKTLKVLDLGGNALREIKGLKECVALQELWLGKNKIAQIGDGLESLSKLKIISVQSNRLINVRGVNTLEALEELYLSDCGIVLDDVGGAELERLTKLNTLDLTNNRIDSTIHMPNLPQLTDLWLAGNAVASFEALDGLAAKLPQLTTLYLERTPLREDFEYRKRLKTMIPTLTQIDADRCE